MKDFSVVVIGCEEEKEMELTVDLTRLRAMPQERPFPTGVLFGVSRSSTTEAEGGLLHFVTLSNCGQGTNDVGRTGVWLDESAGPLHVLLWDRRAEAFSVLPPDAPQHTRVQEMLAGGARLCDYAYLNVWRSFSSGVTRSVLERLLVPPGVLVVPGASTNANDDNTGAEIEKTSTEMDVEGNSGSSSGGAQRKQRHVEALLLQQQWKAGAGQQLTPYFAEGAGRAPSWPELYPPASTIAEMSVPERTAFYFDSSQRLEWVLGRCGGEDALVGGFKVAFVHFLLLACQAGLEHWKHVIRLMCTCGDAAVARRPGLFAAFLRAVAAHLLCADFNELLADPDSSAYGFFGECFGGLYEVLDAECFGSTELMRAAGSLRRALVKRCGIDPTNCSNCNSIVAGDVSVTEENGGPVLLSEDGTRELTEEEALRFLEEARREAGPHTCSERRRKARGQQAEKDNSSSSEPSAGHVERRNRLAEAIDSVQTELREDEKGMDVEAVEKEDSGKATKKTLQPSFKNRRRKKKPNTQAINAHRMTGPMSFGDEDDII